MERKIISGQNGETTIFTKEGKNVGLTEGQWKFVFGVGALALILGAVQLYVPGGIHGAINYGIGVIDTAFDAGVGFLKFLASDTQPLNGINFVDIATGGGSKLPDVFTP